MIGGREYNDKFRQNFHKDWSDEEEPLYLKRYERRAFWAGGQQVQRPCGVIKLPVKEQKAGLLTRAS